MVWLTMQAVEILSNNDWAVWIPVIQAVLTLFSVLAALFTVKISWEKLCDDRVAVAKDREAAAQAVERADMRARQRSMIDLLIAQNANAHFIDSLKKVRLLREDNHSHVSQYVLTDDDTRSAILSVLNQLEFIAVGIRLGVFDESLYKALSYSNVVDTWKTVSGFVCELRRQTGFPTLFQDIEELAKKWEKDPIKRI